MKITASITNRSKIVFRFTGLTGVKATVENPRGSVEKLSPKESVEGADTVLREGFKKKKH